MAMKVHGVALSPPTQRVLACLNEKGLDYELVSVDLMAGEHKKPSHLSLNPFGQVPAFEDGDLKLFESRAINNYIAHAYAEKGAPLVTKDLKKMAILGVGLEVEAHQFDPPASKIFYELVVNPYMGRPTDESVVIENEAKLAKVLDVYEARLAENKYLGGDAFTLADLNHLPALENLMGTRAKAVIEARAHVSSWCNEILARPAWKKVVAMKGNI